MPGAMCQVSGVRCQVSGVRCHMSDFKYFLDIVVWIVGEGSLLVLAQIVQLYALQMSQKAPNSPFTILVAPILLFMIFQ